MRDAPGTRHGPTRGSEAVGGPLLTVQDLAAYLDVPVKTIYMWRHRSTGPRGFRVGRHLRFRWAEVEEWVAELASGDGD